MTSLKPPQNPCQCTLSPNVAPVQTKCQTRQLELQFLQYSQNLPQKMSKKNANSSHFILSFKRFITVDFSLMTFRFTPFRCSMTLTMGSRLPSVVQICMRALISLQDSTSDQENDTNSQDSSTFKQPRSFPSTKTKSRKPPS